MFPSRSCLEYHFHKTLLNRKSSMTQYIWEMRHIGILKAEERFKLCLTHFPNLLFTDIFFFAYLFILKSTYYHSSELSFWGIYFGKLWLTGFSYFFQRGLVFNFLFSPLNPTHLAEASSVFAASYSCVFSQSRFPPFLFLFISRYPMDVL